MSSPDQPTMDTPPSNPPSEQETHVSQDDPNPGSPDLSTQNQVPPQPGGRANNTIAVRAFSVQWLLLVFLAMISPNVAPLPPPRTTNHKKNYYHTLTHRWCIPLINWGSFPVKWKWSALKELNQMNLSHENQKIVKDHHEAEILREMEALGCHPQTGEKATVGYIHHIMHEGGVDPDAPNHITATFRDGKKKYFPNDHNGGRYRHVLVNSTTMESHPVIKTAWQKNNSAIKDKYSKRREPPLLSSLPPLPEGAGQTR